MAVKKTTKVNEDIDNTSKGSSAAAKSVMNKTVALDKITQAILGASGDDWTKLSAVLDQVDHQADGVKNGADAQNKASVAMKGAVKEDLALIFGDNEELSEELQEKISTLFEAAVNTRVNLELETLKEELQESFEEEMTAVTEQLIENIDLYLSEGTNQWLENNQVAIDTSLRGEITENFISGLRNLFIEHNFSIPEDEESLVENLVETNNELEDQLNNALNENIENEQLMGEIIKENLIYRAAEGLPITSIEKFKQLAENVDFNGDIDEFVGKLDVLKESNLKIPTSNKTEVKMVTEEIGYEDDEKKVSSGTMGIYEKALSNSLRSSK